MKSSTISTAKMIMALALTGLMNASLIFGLTGKDAGHSEASSRTDTTSPTESTHPAPMSVKSTLANGVKYDIVDLGVLPGLPGSFIGSSKALGINNAGQVVGQTSIYSPTCPNFDPPHHAFIWDPTLGMRDLDASPFICKGTATSINDAGYVTGYETYSTLLPHCAGYYHGVLWIPDSTGSFGMNDLGEIRPPACESTFAQAVSPAGDTVVGNSGHFGAFLWHQGAQPGVGTFEELGANSSAYGINSSGVVVGGYTTFSGKFHAYRRAPNGTMTDLPPLPGYLQSEAFAINTDNQVVGYSEDLKSDTATYWDSTGNPHDIGVLDGFAWAINGRGEVVGEDDFGGAFLWSEAGGLVFLRDRIPQNSGWRLDKAYGINDTGQIVGSGVHNGLFNAFLLTPDGLKIAKPTQNQNFTLGQQNWTATYPIAFQAELSPPDTNSTADWNVILEYKTSGGKGASQDQRTFQTSGTTSHAEIYKSMGGRLTINAATMANSQALKADPVVAFITGVAIPDTEITNRLISLYGGATPNLLTGIAKKESSYRQFKTANLFALMGLWPHESYDGGSHIGLMQMPVSMSRAWDWEINTADGADLFKQKLNLAKNRMNKIIQNHPGLKPLTAVELENMAVLLYGEHASTSLDKQYYAPVATKAGWDWVVNSTGNSDGVNYANIVRAQVVSSGTQSTDHLSSFSWEPVTSIQTVANPKDPADFNWTTTGSNRVSDQTWEKSEIASFLDKVTNSEELPSSVGDFRFIELNADGQIELVATADYSGREFYNTLLVINRDMSVFRAQTIDVCNMVSLRNNIRDLNQDGRLELIITQALTPYLGARPYACWTPIYANIESKFTDQSATFTSYYNNEVIGQLEQQLDQLRSSGGSSYDIDTTQMQLDKILRTIGVDTRAGLTSALNWVTDADPVYRVFAVSVLKEIGGVDAVDAISHLAQDSDPDVGIFAVSVSQPIDDAQFFVRQQYRDFLNREPDQGGWDYWTSQITQCGSDPSCIRAKRIDVSNAFFYELEYQQTAAYVFRLYRAAFGNNQPSPNPDSSNLNEAKKIPSYAVFSTDRARLIGSANLAQDQVALANLFVSRSEFLSKYPSSLTLDQFVDAVIAAIKSDDGVDLSSQRSALIALGNRGAVLYRIADDNLQTNPINNRAFVDAEYNRSFVASQYFGYLRRDADIGGFLFWLGQVNSGPLRDTLKQHAMVCSFITAAEYQLRFGSVVTHTNAECPQ